MILAVLFGSTLLLSAVIGQDVIGNVAFTAALHDDTIVNGGEIVKYPNWFTNQGGAYDNETGIFTVPKGGIYIFHIHALTIHDKEFWLDLYQNDKYHVSIFGRLDDDYASGSNTISLKLIKNDKIYLKAHRTAYLYGRKEDVYATFTGYLIGTIKTRV